MKLSLQDDMVRISVTDDGQGFPFPGSYDMAELRAGGLGPKSLMERTASLHGQLTVDSGGSGTRLEIALPLHSAVPAPSRLSGVPDGGFPYPSHQGTDHAD